MRLRATVLMWVLAVALILAPGADARAGSRLGVVIVLDQYCGEHLSRYGHLFTGGLARLQQGGVVFAEAHHDHAMTLTATGHAALSTGRYPKRHGIVGNHWIERASGQRVYCCGDSTVSILGDPEGQGRSPRYLMTDALGDWLKQSWPDAKVYAVSQKDRSAIMLGGLRPDGVYWFDDAKGRMVTSTYYVETMPKWAAGYDCFPIREKAIREGWRKTGSAGHYDHANVDDFPAENDGVNTTFPHLYDSAAAIARTPSEWLVETPFGDELVLDFARTLASAERLGQDTIPDLLYISLSATDYIGHSFGPFSQEVLDALLRADQYIGKFLSSLDSLVGIGAYSVALSSDHGVMPLPEEIVLQGERAERILRADARQHFDAAARQVADAIGVVTPLIIGQTNGLMLDTKIAEEHGVRPPDLREAVAEQLRQIDYVDDVMTYEDLSLPDATGRGYRAMYRQSFHPDRTPDIVIRYKENILVLDSPYGTTHGTPYGYDTHVPLIFWGAGVVPAEKPVKDRVRTVDVAPTMAALLGLAVPGDLDGAVLEGVIGDE